MDDRVDEGGVALHDDLVGAVDVAVEQGHAVFLRGDGADEALDERCPLGPVGRWEIEGLDERGAEPEHQHEAGGDVGGDASRRAALLPGRRRA